MATTALVSTNILEPILPKLFPCGMEKLVDDTSTSLDGKDKVFLNGDWVGICEDSHNFVTKLRTLRRRKKLPHQVFLFFRFYIALVLVRLLGFHCAAV